MPTQLKSLSSWAKRQFSNSVMHSMPGDAAQMQKIGSVKHNTAFYRQTVANGCYTANEIVSSMRHYAVLFCMGVLGEICPKLSPGWRPC